MANDPSHVIPAQAGIFLFRATPEVRQRVRAVLKTEEMSAAEIKAITEGEMDSRHDYLNAEFGKP